jgi:hypothetical protein
MRHLNAGFLSVQTLTHNLSSSVCLLPFFL